MGQRESVLSVGRLVIPVEHQDRFKYKLRIGKVEEAATIVEKWMKRRLQSGDLSPEDHSQYMQKLAGILP